MHGMQEEKGEVSVRVCMSERQPLMRYIFKSGRRRTREEAWPSLLPAWMMVAGANRCSQTRHIIALIHDFLCEWKEKWELLWLVHFRKEIRGSEAERKEKKVCLGTAKKDFEEDESCYPTIARGPVIISPSSSSASSSGVSMTLMRDSQ